MVSREHKKAALHENLQLLRSITNSHALNKTSIIVDASKYIEDLKKKVQQLNQDIENAQSSTDPFPEVNVETLENGYRINVYSDKSSPGLLVCILEVFEDLGLHVLDARVSCTDSFQLEAVGREHEGFEGNIDAQMVRQTVLEAVNNWRQNGERE